MPEPHVMPVERWPDGRVLITGGTGLVGARIAGWLRRAGVSVRAVVRQQSAAVAVRALEEMGAEVALGDVTDFAVMRRICAGCTCVLNTAAITRRTPCGRRATWRINANGPAIVWRAAHEAGVRRFVHCSTAGVHGPLWRWPIDENAPMRPDTAYRRSKCRGEANLQREAQVGGGPDLVIARLASVTGPGTARTWRTLHESVVGGRTRLLGRGDRPIHIVDIDDACQGLVRCLTEPRAAGGRYHIAAAVPTPILALMRAFAQAAGTDLRVSRWPRQPLAGLALAASRVGGFVGWEPDILHAMNFLAATRAYRIDRARDEMGYQPIHDMEQTVARTIADFGIAPSPRVQATAQAATPAFDVRVPT